MFVHESLRIKNSASYRLSTYTNHPTHHVYVQTSRSLPVINTKPPSPWWVKWTLTGPAQTLYSSSWRRRRGASWVMMWVLVMCTSSLSACHLWQIKRIRYRLSNLRLPCACMLHDYSKGWGGWTMRLCAIITYNSLSKLARKSGGWGIRSWPLSS